MPGRPRAIGIPQQKVVPLRLIDSGVKELLHLFGKSSLNAERNADLWWPGTGGPPASDSLQVDGVLIELANASLVLSRR